MELKAKLAQWASSQSDELNGDSTVDSLLDLTVERFRERCGLPEGTPERLTTSTVDKYETVANVHIRPNLGSLLVREVTTQRIDDFLSSVKEGTNVRSVAVRGGESGERKTITEPGPGATTQARHCRRLLREAFTLARKYQAVPFNPVLEADPVLVPFKKGRIATIDEVMGIRRWLIKRESGLDFDPKTETWVPHNGRPRSDHLHDLLEVFVATGARIAEVLALQWSDIDFDAKPKPTVLIAAQIEQRKGEPLNRAPNRKQHAREIVVTLPAPAVAILKARRERMKEWPNPMDLVFPSATFGLRSPHNVRRQLRVALKGSSFEGITPHSFRRGVGTAVEKSMGIKSASEQLGHGDARVTRKHYVEDHPVVQDSADALAGFFGADDGGPSPINGD
jgi:integrase